MERDRELERSEETEKTRGVGNWLRDRRCFATNLSFPPRSNASEGKNVGREGIGALYLAPSFSNEISVSATNFTLLSFQPLSPRFCPRRECLAPSLPPEIRDKFLGLFARLDTPAISRVFEEG